MSSREREVNEVSSLSYIFINPHLDLCVTLLALFLLLLPVKCISAHQGFCVKRICDPQKAFLCDILF